MILRVASVEPPVRLAVVDVPRSCSSQARARLFALDLGGSTSARSRAAVRRRRPMLLGPLSTARPPDHSLAFWAASPRGLRLGHGFSRRGGLRARPCRSYMVDALAQHVIRVSA